MNPKLKFIKKFAHISIAGICKKLGVNKSNLWHGTMAQDKVDLVYITVLEELKNIIDEVKGEL